jgi:hypothetical protein
MTLWGSRCGSVRRERGYRHLWVISAASGAQLRLTGHQGDKHIIRSDREAETLNYAPLQSRRSQGTLSYLGVPAGFDWEATAPVTIRIIPSLLLRM